MIPGQLSSSVEAPAFPSRPDNSRDAARSGGMGGAEPSGATRSAYFGASMARTASTRPSLERAPWHAQPEAGGTSGECGLSRVQPCRHTLCRHRSRELARRPSLCRLARCFEVVRRPLPRRVIATPVRLVAVLVLLDHCQCRSKPLVLHDLTRFDRLDLVEFPKWQ